MIFSNALTLIFLLTLLTLITKPLGIYLYKILHPEEKTFLDILWKKPEKFLYKVFRINPKEEQSAKDYLYSLFIFSLFSLSLSFCVLKFQHLFPLNPQNFPSLPWALALNIAVSYVTNTNWQSYAGETTLSYFSQMFALTVQNFLSPIVGLCVAAALVRGIARKKMTTLGNFWVDLTRLSLYLFLPLALLGATFFASQGVIQNFHSYKTAETLENQRQVVIQGPIASQEAIKLLGSNGGGFTAANSAHPYENPNPLTNLFSIFLVLLLPTAQTYYFGREIKNQKHGWSLYAAMTFLFVLTTFLSFHFETAGNPIFQKIAKTNTSINMEGKEMRFGIFSSSLFASTMTSTSTGAVNSSLTCYTPLGSMLLFLNMQLGEIIFGGVGSGLCGMILFTLFSIFICGLVIGRTPEYLGKRIEAPEIKVSILTILLFFFFILSFSSIACLSSLGIDNVKNAGPHSFSELLYNFTSAVANNGSSFDGGKINTLYNILSACAMLFGRFVTLSLVIVLAHFFVKKPKHPTGDGSFPLSGTTFVLLLLGVILIIGALTFLPTLSMGPVLENFYINRETFF
jgi:K+-transporting ATPase ATPase A chain